MSKNLPVTTMKRVIKKVGANICVSKKASIGLAKELERYGVEIAKEALEYAMYAARRTVQDKDIEAAIKAIWRRHQK